MALPQKVWLETTWGFYHTVEVTKTDPDTLEEYKDFEERRLIHEVLLLYLVVQEKQPLVLPLVRLVRLLTVSGVLIFSF